MKVTAEADVCEKEVLVSEESHDYGSSSNDESPIKNEKLLNGTTSSPPPPSTQEEGSNNEKKSEEDVYYIHDTGITIKIISPGAEPFELQVSSSEIVQELHQLLMEREETCHRTCFSLQLDNVTLDNFAELKSIAGLKDGSVIKVVEEPYTCREARIHVKHVRDLIKASDWSDAYGGTDCASLSFLSDVLNAGICTKTRVVDCTPPECIYPGTPTPFSLSLIYPDMRDTKPISCLKVLGASGWNPPPGSRKLHGDLLYLVVVTLEDKTCHITACPRGFYLNRSSMETFDPLPSTPSPYLSHSLIDLLSALSPAFRKAFSGVQKRRMGRHPFERVATPYQVYSWLSPLLPHSFDPLRAEEAFSSKLGYEEHIPGQTRDWNEELQSTKELPRATLPQRLLRERAIFKVHSDFVSAATRGAVAVIDGNIMAINPGESTKMQMFIWSNIFFSLGFDVRDHYKEVGGDAAAFVAPSNDLQGVAAYSAIDLEGLYTLGTVVVDYRGYRVTAQSIIPGILEREQDQSVVYGSIDFGKTVVSNEKYLELLRRGGQKLKILPHYLLNEKDETLQLCSSVECKGIIGNDGRYYILDLLRTFPPDINYLPDAEVELSEEVRELGYPMTHPHKLSCLRQELVNAFVETRYMTFIKVAAYHLQKFGFKNQRAGSGGEGHSSTHESSSSQTQEILDNSTQDSGTENNEERSTLYAIRSAAASVCSLSSTEFDIRFNPDLFSPNVRHATPCYFSDGPTHLESDSLDKNEDKNRKKYPPLPAQIKLNEEACNYLLLIQIPAFVRDLTSNSSHASDSGSSFFGPNALIMDGRSLSGAMHGRGINIRYLGRIANLLVEREKNEEIGESRVVVINNGHSSSTSSSPPPPPQTPHYLTTISIMELVSRSAKHIYNPYIQGVGAANQSLAISHFLNCLFMSGQTVVPPVYADELIPSSWRGKSGRGKGSKSGSKLNGPPPKQIFNGLNGSNSSTSGGEDWASLTPSSLWTRIKKEMENYYGFSIPPPPTTADSLDSLLSSYSISRLSLLRSLSTSLGLQLLLRDYFTISSSSSTTNNSTNSTNSTGTKGGREGKGNANIFTQSDILNVFPVVKHIEPKASDAYGLLASAQSKMSSGYFRDGYELLSEALNLLNNVYGAMHPDIALCLRSLARLNYVMGEYEDAEALQTKAVFMSERLLGIDHPTTILEYTHLSLYCFGVGHLTASIKLLYRARYLSILVCGENHPHVALLDSNIGLILHAVYEYDLSLKFLEKALSLTKKYYGPRSIKTAVGHHLVARTQSCLGDFRSALMNERETYSIYKEQLGEKHEKTQGASDCLEHLTQQAVVLQKKINDMAHGKGLPPLQIQPPTMGSVRDMLNLINGILFMHISHEDIENFKAEFERSEQKRSEE